MAPWALLPRVFVALLPCGLVALLLCGLVALWLCGLAALWPCVLLVLLPCGPGFGVKSSVVERFESTTMLGICQEYARNTLGLC